jgi:transposase
MARIQNNTRRPKRKALEITGKDTVFVGMDVHKKDVHVAVRVNGQEAFTAVVSANPRAVLAFLEPYRPGIRKVVYEAGPTGYSLVWALRSAEIPAAVVVPGKIPRPATEEAKSDRLDCRKLAEYAEKDMLREVTVPTPEETAARQLQRLRDDFVKSRREAKQKIKAFLLMHGLPEPEGLAHWSETAFEVLRSMPMQPILRFCFDRMLEHLLHVEDEVEQVSRQLQLIAKTGHAEEMKRLQTHPGVGKTTAIQVITEIYQPGRFENRCQIAAYTGLAPKVRQSGSSRTSGPLLKGGRNTLRASLVEAAWTWIRMDKGAYKVYCRLVRNTGSAKKAIVAMARRMLINLWLMLVRKQNYRPSWA